MPDQSKLRATTVRRRRKTRQNAAVLHGVRPADVCTRGQMRALVLRAGDCMSGWHMPPAAVLVVEDDPDLRSMMDQLLHLEGFAPVTAANGLEALRLLKSGLRAQAILLDLMMPIMDGWEFRREQRLDPEIADIPVIVLSAASHPRHDELQAAAVFLKPLPFEQVLAAIRRHASVRYA